MLGADERQGLLDARPDLRRLDARVLQAEGNLVRDAAHHDLILRVLEHRGDGPDELSRMRLAGVEPGDDDPPGEPAAVEVRHETGERAQERRLS